MKKTLSLTKHLGIALLAGAMILASASCSNKAENTTLANKTDSLSWAMGMSLAQTAQNGIYDFNNEIVLKAFQSTLKGEKQPLDEKAYNEACQYIAFLVAKHDRELNTQQQTNSEAKQKEAFEKLLAQNPNIKKAPEGYYYEVLREGHGPKATVGKRINFDFTNTNMYTGEVVDKSYGRQGSITHNLGKPMFQGLIYAMQLMNAGSKYRFYFPFNLIGNANGVPPFTPMIYEIELHEIYND